MSALTPGKGDADIHAPSRAQRALARRVAESRATIPWLECTARASRSSAHEGRTAGSLIAACAAALREVPRANAAYRDGAFELYSRVNVGVLLATEDAYVLATVFDADQKPVPELEREVDALSARALAGALTAPELSGSTFSLTDMSGSVLEACSPPIVPPHAAALGAGGWHSAPVIRDGGIVPGHVMTLTIACDHRILYSEHAARFLEIVKRTLEEA